MQFTAQSLQQGLSVADHVGELPDRPFAADLAAGGLTSPFVHDALVVFSAIVAVPEAGYPTTVPQARFWS